MTPKDRSLIATTPAAPIAAAGYDTHRKLRHDLNNPLSTIGIEVYSLRRALGLASAALDAGNLVAAGSELRAIADMVANIDDARQRIHDLAAGLGRHPEQP